MVVKNLELEINIVDIFKHLNFLNNNINNLDYDTIFDNINNLCYLFYMGVKIKDSEVYRELLNLLNDLIPKLGTRKHKTDYENIYYLVLTLKNCLELSVDDFVDLAGGLSLEYLKTLNFIEIGKVVERKILNDNKS